jgi:hypothetical protein
MSNDTTHTQLVTLLSQYAAGSIDAETLRTQLAVPQFSAALRTLVGQTLATARGDQISVGDIANTKGVAIGADALAIGEIVLHVVHNLHGNQTTIAGDVNGPVLSGTFSGPVTIYATPPPNPVAPESRPPTPTVAALKRATLERRIAALSEEYSAINQQIDTTIDAGQKLRLERKAADLLAEIARIEAEISPSR